jgi:hypothetical protein
MMTWVESIQSPSAPVHTYGLYQVVISDDTNSCLSVCQTGLPPDSVRCTPCTRYGISTVDVTLARPSWWVACCLLLTGSTDLKHHHHWHIVIWPPAIHTISISPDARLRL